MRVRTDADSAAADDGGIGRARHQLLVVLEVGNAIRFACCWYRSGRWQLRPGCEDEKVIGDRLPVVEDYLSWKDLRRSGRDERSGVWWTAVERVRVGYERFVLEPRDNSESRKREQMLIAKSQYSVSITM